MKHLPFPKPGIFLTAALLAGCQTAPTPAPAPAAPTPAASAAPPKPPPAFSADVHATIGAGHGSGSLRWPQPRPVFAPDLSNAEFKTGAWVWVDGILTSRGEKGDDIWTKASYGDFVLNLDFRCHENTHGGVFLRCSDTEKWLQNAIEVRILQGDDSDKHATGAIFDCLAPTRQKDIAPGTWHHFTIAARGSHIKVVLDGEQIVDMNLDKWKEPHMNPDGTKNPFDKACKDLARSGRIGLEYPTGTIEFKNIVVDPL
jgi:hypothetical protein